MEEKKLVLPIEAFFPKTVLVIKDRLMTYDEWLSSKGLAIPELHYRSSITGKFVSLYAHEFRLMYEDYKRELNLG